MASDWSVVVLTGGQSSRLGRDKATADLGGQTLLEHVLTSLPGDVPVVIVGPEPSEVPEQAVVTREDPAGGGPVAGIAAGLLLVETELVAVLAVDMPWAGALLPELAVRVRAGGFEGALPQDEQGRAQPLAAVYRREALTRALAQAPASGRSMRSVLANLRIEVVGVSRPDSLRDIDTPADLAAARRSVIPGEANRREEAGMDDWVAAVKAAVGVDGSVDVDQILDLAREAAHGVARPAAPLTTYLMGVAVGAGQDPDEVAARLTLLAREWPKPE